jgi:hypothetical protein
MYVTPGDSVQRPLTGGPRGWPAGQLLSRFRPQLLGHVFYRLISQPKSILQDSLDV